MILHWLCMLIDFLCVPLPKSIDNVVLMRSTATTPHQVWQGGRAVGVGRWSISGLY